jgi:hypothetical protein
VVVVVAVVVMVVVVVVLVLVLVVVAAASQISGSTTWKVKSTLLIRALILWPGLAQRLSHI